MSGLAPPGPVYLSAAQLSARVSELGGELTAAFAGGDLVLVASLKASIVLLADLSRSVAVAHALDTIEIERFSAPAQALGDGRPPGARILKDIDLDVRGRDVVLVEDVVDTGLTLSFLVRHIASSAPRSLAALTLLDRPYRRLATDLPLRWVGFTVTDDLFVGYGFDLDERYRNLPDLHVLPGVAAPI